jgi:hypothetical protein
MTRLLVLGAVALAASIVANLGVRTIALAFIDVADDFQPLQPGPIIVVTTIGVVLAMLAFVIVSRVSRTPRHTYRLVALVALVVSLIPNIGLLISPPDQEQFTGVTNSAVVVLMLLHVVTAAIVVAVLTWRRA